MRVLRILTVALAAVVLIASVVTYFTSLGTKDAPVITCSVENRIEASVFVTDEELLQYVSAEDKQDGDISDRIKVMRKKFFADAETKTCSITFAVSDSDNNVTTLQRLLVFTDYESPKIELITDFIFPSGYSYDFRKYVTVNDMLDGNLDDQIKIISADLTNAKGTYPVNIKVSNSVGDTAELNIEAIITDEDYFNIKVRLKEYIMYVPKGAEINYMDNIRDIFNNGPPIEETVEDVKLDTSEVNLEEPGVYYAYYRLLDEDDEVKSLTRLIVVVTED